MTRLMIAAAVAALLAVPAIAQPEPPPTTSPTAATITPARPTARVPMTRTDVEARLRQRLTQMDTDRDGAVTRGEVVKQRQDRRFAALDANRDGAISRAEFDARSTARMTRREARQDARADRREARGNDRPMRGQRGQRGEIAALAMGGADGRIVIAEVVKRALDRFDATDTNRDGTISPDERRTMREMRRAERRERRG